MDIIINSLYQDKDVFLRELVSNAADACDKKRFLSLSDGSSSETLKVRVKSDKEKNTLTIEDSGVGMTKTELVNNLGRIAQSGTKKFMEALGGAQDDVNLIGQFGVGFYSGYLVADRITVVSKSASDETQWRWESSAGSSFTVKDDTTFDDHEPMLSSSGTRITLHLKEDCDEYVDEFKLRDMLKRYSSFIVFPIELWSEKTDYKQEVDADAPAPAEGEAPKMKSVTVKSTDWERVNSQKPIWLRSPKDVNATEYTDFYKSTFRAYDEPVAKTHFSLEGQVEFRALLYVPSVVPFELSKDMFSESSKAVKLYVKRVFINDKFQELLPRWLTFVRGIVDSEDLPLNVGREILQKSKMLSVINKRLVKKSIDMFTGIAAQGEDEYMKFWKNFGRYIKVGVLEDDNVKDDLAPLLRFSTTKSGDDLKSLGSYVDAMQANQTDIFYVSGDGKAAAARSPVLEKLRALDLEVVYLTEPLDEMAFQSIGTFQGKRLVDAASADLTALLAASGDEGVAEEAKALRESAAKDYEEVCEWLQDALKSKEVSKVEVSAKLTDSPAALTQGAYGMSPTMQRYMRAQAVASGQEDMLGSMGQMNQATLEVNPTHPIVLKLKALFEAAPDAAPTKDFGYLLYDVAALASGYSIDDPAAFAVRVSALMASDAVAVAPAGPSDAQVVDAPAAAEVAPAAEVAEAVEVVAEPVEVVAEPSAAAAAEPAAEVAEAPAAEATAKPAAADL